MAKKRAKKKVTKKKVSKKKLSKSNRTRARSKKVSSGNPNPSTTQIAPYMYKPGQSGNPAGRAPGVRNLSTRLWALLEEIQEDTGQTLEDKIVAACDENPNMLVAMVHKLLPNMNQDVIRPEDVTSILDQVVASIAKHVKDKTLLKRIIKELEQIDVKPSKK